MDQKKLADYLFLIKYLSESQEVLLEYQTRIDAIVQLVVGNDLIDYPALKLHLYLRELSDSVERAVFLSEDVMSTLHRISNLMASKGGSDISGDEVERTL